MNRQAVPGRAALLSRSGGSADKGKTRVLIAFLSEKHRETTKTNCCCRPNRRLIDHRKRFNCKGRSTPNQRLVVKVIKQANE
jgi:hypothetical protein